jgi:hypothetical protein
MVGQLLFVKDGFVVDSMHCTIFQSTWTCGRELDNFRKTYFNNWLVERITSALSTTAKMAMEWHKLYGQITMHFACLSQAVLASLMRHPIEEIWMKK